MTRIRFGRAGARPERLALRVARRYAPELGLLEGRLLLSDMTAPTTTASLNGTMGQNGFFVSPVTVNFSATDPDNTPAELMTSFSVNGGSTQTGSTLSLPSDGTFTVAFQSSDPAGNVEATQTLVVKIDQTAPVVTVMASPTTLWPPNHRYVSVEVTGQVTDSGSGPASTVSWSVMDSDGQLHPMGTARVDSNGTFTFDVSLQASRRGQDFGGRIYTIMVTGSDTAGNTTTASTAVIVPHDQGHHNGQGIGNAGMNGGSGGDGGGSGSHGHGHQHSTGHHVLTAGTGNHGHHGGNGHHGGSGGGSGGNGDGQGGDNGNGNGNGHGHGHGHGHGG